MIRIDLHNRAAFQLSCDLKRIGFQRIIGIGSLGNRHNMGLDALQV